MIVLGIGLKAQPTKSEVLARNVAVKMRDSLKLSSQDEQRIYQLNMQIVQEKAKLWQEYRSSPSLRSHLQVAENKRDSLYGTVLSREKYFEYRQKKKYLFP